MNYNNLNFLQNQNQIQQNNQNQNQSQTQQNNQSNQNILNTTTTNSNVTTNPFQNTFTFNNNNTSLEQNNFLQNQTNINLLPKLPKKRRAISRKACDNCRKAHSCCTDFRPCKRCISLQIECQDTPSKKRGRKKKFTQNNPTDLNLIDTNLIKDNNGNLILQNMNNGGMVVGTGGVKFVLNNQNITNNNLEQIKAKPQLKQVLPRALTSVGKYFNNN
jgi:hypothetical protein